MDLPVLWVRGRREVAGVSMVGLSQRDQHLCMTGVHAVGIVRSMPWVIAAELRHLLEDRGVVRIPRRGSFPLGWRCVACEDRGGGKGQPEAGRSSCSGHCQPPGAALSTASMS